MRINAADRDAIINAWRSVNADHMGNKFGILGKTFKLADYAMKANNVKEKSIEGYKTGNWGPLLREIATWVISGITASVALAVLSAVLGSMFVGIGVSATAIAIIAIVTASLLASLIDNKFVERLNNEIISLMK